MIAVPGIERLAGADGVVLGIAVDHRDSFHAALRARGVAGIDDALVAAIKVDVIRALGAAATVLLVDHEVGWPALVDAAGAPSGAAIAMPLEAQGYGALHQVERTVLVERPTPADAVLAGASACKLLLPIRPDHAARAGVQLDVARKAIDACHAAGLPLILEPIVWSAPGERLDDAHRAELIVDVARQLARVAPGLLKLQYPGSRDACRAVHDACAGHPWVLLGGGAPLEELECHVHDACEAGARGFIVGRSLFADALDRDPDRRRRWLHDVARPAFERLVRAARAHPA